MKIDPYWLSATYCSPCWPTFSDVTLISQGVADEAGDHYELHSPPTEPEPGSRVEWSVCQPAVCPNAISWMCRRRRERQIGRQSCQKTCVIVWHCDTGQAHRLSVFRDRRHSLSNSFAEYWESKQTLPVSHRHALYTNDSHSRSIGLDIYKEPFLPLPSQL